MATLMERLKQLGIGVKAPERKPEQVPEGFRTFTGKQNLDTEKLLNINGKTYIGPKFPRAEQPSEMRSRFPVTGTQAQASLEPPRPRFPIPGTQALSGMGLFTQRDANPSSTMPPLVSREAGTAVGMGGEGGYSQGGDIGALRDQENSEIMAIEDEAQLLENGRLAEEAMAKERMLRQRDEDRAAAFGGARDTVVDSLKRFDAGFQDIFDQKFNAADAARAVLDKAIAQRESAADAEEKRKEQRLNDQILQNSRELTNSLIQQQLENSRQQRAAQDLMTLEAQVQRANNQMDQTNYVLRNSGLFGQGMRGPSYSNPMQPTMSETYAQPEYYSDPFEIKRLYE